MNVIFLTMAPFRTISERGIYTDLLRHFQEEGHRVFVVSPRERRLKIATNVEVQNGVTMLGVRTLNLQKSSVIEKGIGQVLVEGQFKRAIKKYLSGEHFDLIYYSTPPITFPKVIRYLRKKNPHAKTYLLLKDIFPQNAVDLRMMSKTGIKGLVYEFFRKKEKLMYSLSDNIGCMSPANVRYLLEHNPEITADRVEVAPNSIKLTETTETEEERKLREKNERTFIRKKYDLPTNVPIFIYGGNLGKPQCIDYIIRCLESNYRRTDCFFIVIGTGTEFPKLLTWYEENKSGNVKVMKGLPKEDYDMLVQGCDVGLIFLDHRFTIPNFPSRLLGYIEYKIPVICATDPNSDMGPIAEENGFGYCCESVKPEDFTTLVDRMLSSDRKAMGEKGYQFLKENYLVEHTYNAIMAHLKLE